MSSTLLNHVEMALEDGITDPENIQTHLLTPRRTARSKSCTVGPDACFDAGRDVGGEDGAEGVPIFSPAAKAFAAGRRVAGHAIAGARQIFAAATVRPALSPCAGRASSRLASNAARRGIRIMGR